MLGLKTQQYIGHYTEHTFYKKKFTQDTLALNILGQTNMHSSFLKQLISVLFKYDDDQSLFFPSQLPNCIINIKICGRVKILPSWLILVVKTSRFYLTITVQWMQRSSFNLTQVFNFVIHLKTYIFYMFFYQFCNGCLQICKKKSACVMNFQRSISSFLRQQLSSENCSHLPIAKPMIYEGVDPVSIFVTA